MSGGERCSILAVNPEKVIAAQDNPELAAVLEGSELLIPDGIGVVVAMRLRARRAQRVAGSELMPALCAMAAQEGYSVFLLGADEQTNEAAATQLETRYQGLRVAGRHHGYLQEHEYEAMIHTINASDADLLFVALGSPKQELWIGRFREALQVPVIQGVGGTFDVIAGRVQRAPQFWIRLNLEWLYRLLSQPQRLLRQRALPRFLWQMVLRPRG